MTKSINSMTMMASWGKTEHPPLMTRAEVELLSSLITPEIKVVVELGCYAGGMTIRIAEKLSPNGRIYPVDIFAINRADIYDYVTKERFPKYPNITLIEKTTKAAAVDFNEPIDLLFIDADHQDDQILADLRNWLPKVKSGGIVAIHDYFNEDFPSVQRRTEEFTGGWESLGQADSLLIKRKP